MQNRSKALIGVVAGLAVMAGIVVTVQLLDDPDGSQAALEVLPDDATSFTFVDRDAWAERTGLDDIGHDFTDGDADRYVKETVADGAGATPLAQYFRSMEDAAFNEFDVDWYVAGRDQSESGEGHMWSAYRMDDDLDLEKIGDALQDAGFEESEVSGHRRFTAELAQADQGGMLGDYPTVALHDVTLLENDHLMIISSDPEDVIDVIEGDAESLSDNEDIDAVMDAADNIEFAQVARGDAVRCDAGIGTKATPEAMDQLESDPLLGPLGHPRATGNFVVTDGDDAAAITSLAFDDEDAAEKDRAAREEWLNDGHDLASLQPNSDLFSVDSVEQDDNVVVATTDWEGGPSMLLRAVNQGVGPAICTP